MSRLKELMARWSKNPSSRAFLPLAEELRRLGRYEDAERTCRKGLERHPKYHSARVLLGRTLLEQDRQDEAAQEFRSVLEKEPQNLLAGRLLAGIYRSRGELDEALATLRKLQFHYPDDLEVRTQVYDLERYPDGVGESMGAGANPALTQSDDVLATNTLAEIFLRQGMVDRALGVYESMLRADPDNEPVRRRISEILGTAPDSEESSSGYEPVGEEIFDQPREKPSRRVIQGLQNWLIGIQKG